MHEDTCVEVLRPSLRTSRGDHPTLDVDTYARQIVQPGSPRLSLIITVANGDQKNISPHSKSRPTR